MNAAPFRILLLAVAWLSALAGAQSRARATEAPMVAIMPAVLSTGHGSARLDKEGGPLAERVQLGLGGGNAWRFVERAALDRLLREQALSAAGGTDEMSAVRRGRLLHADWILRLRLRADDLRSPRLEAEVVDALRADRLARIDRPLSELPDESWLHLPDDKVAALAQDTAARALEAALVRRAAMAGLTAVAPLGFVNAGETDRLASFAGRLLEALRAAHPAARVFAYEGADETLAESGLFQAGMTNLDSSAWAGVADAFLWGDFYEDPGFVGETAATPVVLNLYLWRGTGPPSRLVFNGTFGTLDALARDAARAALDAAAGARVEATEGTRRQAADLLLASAERLEDKAPGHAAGETARARHARQTLRAHLLGLAVFFAPEDGPLHERYIELRHRLADNDAGRRRWSREFWTFFDGHFLTPGGGPDLGLAARAAAYAVTPPGFGRRFARIGKAWRGAGIDEEAAQDLWKRFIQAAMRHPDEPGLAEAVEALWPTVSRIDPALNVSTSSDFGLRQTLMAVYRENPARGQALLAGKLIAAEPAATPAPVARPAPRSETRPAGPPAVPASPPANVFTAWIRDFPLKLMERARSGPLSDASGLHAPSVSLSPLELESGFSRRREAVALMSVGAFATDGVSLLLARRPGDRGWEQGRAARLMLEPPELAWPRPLANGDAPVTAFWVESPREIWLATGGEGLRVFDPQDGSAADFDSTRGLPRDKVRSLVRGFDALFASGGGGAEDIVATRIDLRTRELSQVSAGSAPELATLPAAARAAIASFPDASAPRVRLPAEPAVVWSLAGTPPVPDPAGRPSIRQLGLPRDHPFLSGTAPPPAKDFFFARLHCVTGARDGLWVAGLKTVVWASGTRHVPLACWVQGDIRGLADDGQRLFIFVTTLNPDAILHSGARFTPDKARLYVYDHQEGRWLGWLVPPHGGNFAAGGDRLAFLRDSTPVSITLFDTSSLRPLTPEELAAVSASEPVPGRAELDLHRRLDAAVSTPGADLSAVRSALEAGADPGDRRWGYNPPLHVAVQKGNFDAFEAMLPYVKKDALAAWFAKGENLGLWLLRDLLKAGRPDLVLRLFDAGAEPRGDRDDAFESLGWLAVKNGDAAVVARLRQFGFVLDRTIDKHPLREAVAQKNAALLEVLLAGPPPGGRRYDPDNSDGDGRTPLFAAAETGWAEGVKLLLDAGARSFAGDYATGRSLRDAAAPWPEVTLALNRRPGAPDNQPEGARAVAEVLKGDSATLDALLLTDGVLRYRDFWHWSVLHHAARAGRAGLVRRLLAAGAPVDLLTGSGESALCLAAFSGDVELVRLLLEAGADVNLSSKQGRLPLHAAAVTGRADLVKLFLAARADVRSRTGTRDDTALILAACFPHEMETTRLLVEAGAPLDAVNNEGFGPLEAAVVSDSPEKIQYLLDRGARWQKSLDGDYHPMDTAARRGLTGSIRKLQQLGLRSPRALSMAKDDATRALLLSDDDPAARLAREDEMLWPDILKDPVNWRARAEAHLAAGGSVNHVSAVWYSPLRFAMWQDDVERIRFLLERGADPGFKPSPWATSEEASPLYGWIMALQNRMSSGRIKKTLEETDTLAIGYIDAFWAQEASPHTRSLLVAGTFRARLPRATAHMIQLGASPRHAAEAFEKATVLTPAERLRWAVILGLTKDANSARNPESPAR